MFAKVTRYTVYPVLVHVIIGFYCIHQQEDNLQDTTPRKYITFTFDVSYDNITFVLLPIIMYIPTMVRVG